MTDALGNKIKIDQIYGYSNRSNGIITVVIGKAIKLSDQTVTLEVIKRGITAYNSNIKEEGFVRPKISVSGNSIFPLQSSETFWIVNQAKDLLMN